MGTDYYKAHLQVQLKPPHFAVITDRWVWSIVLAEPCNDFVVAGAKEICVVCVPSRLTIQVCCVVFTSLACFV